MGNYSFYKKSFSMSYTKYLKEGQVTIFSKSYCPFCTKTINLMKSKGIPHKVYQADLGEMPDAEFAELKQKTGQNTVPNVFFGNTHVGGNDDTQALAANPVKWQAMLEQNGFK